MLQPQGQQSLEAATLCDPRSCLSLKSKAHFPWGTALEQSQGQALRVTWDCLNTNTLEQGSSVCTVLLPFLNSLFTYNVLHCCCTSNTSFPGVSGLQTLPQFRVYLLLCAPVCLCTEPCEMGWQPLSRFFSPVQWCIRWEVAELPPVFPANPFPALICVDMCSKRSWEEPSQGDMTG